MADPHAPTPVRREDRGAVARLVLSSPQNYNALSREMIAALRDALDAIAADEAVRVVVIAAEGKAFSAGHDLRQMQAARAAGVEIAETAIRFLGEVEPRPTITRKRLSQVRPLGDANGLPCPLTEYGTLKALSQLAVICGGQSLPRDVLARPISREVDPHIPMELFA